MTDLESLSINELCAFAGIRRATFYKHFTDKMNFCMFVIEDLRRRFNESFDKKALLNPEVSYYVEYANRIIDFLDSNEKIVDNIISSSSLVSLLQIMLEQNCRETFALLKKSEEAGMQLPASLNITTVMLAGSVTTAILAWLRVGKQIPKERFSEEVSCIIARILGEQSTLSSR